MMNQMLTAYMQTLFEESRDGSLTVGMEIHRMDYDVEWDQQMLETLTVQCIEMVEHLTKLAGRETEAGLGQEARRIWNTYLRPFDDHGLDRSVLKAIWEKEAIGVMLVGEEREISRKYYRWYEEQSLQRLPWKGCAPSGLIYRARRYARLVQLKAPAAVQEAEARHLAEEWVLYHCMK